MTEPSASSIFAEGFFRRRENFVPETHDDDLAACGTATFADSAASVTFCSSTADSLPLNFFPVEVVMSSATALLPKVGDANDGNHDGEKRGDPALELHGESHRWAERKRGRCSHLNGVKRSLFYGKHCLKRLVERRNRGGGRVERGHRPISALVTSPVGEFATRTHFL